jgi:hypothetical protein
MIRSFIIKNKNTYNVEKCDVIFRIILHEKNCKKMKTNFYFNIQINDKYALIFLSKIILKTKLKLK